MRRELWLMALVMGAQACREEADTPQRLAPAIRIDHVTDEPPDPDAPAAARAGTQPTRSGNEVTRPESPIDSRIVDLATVTWNDAPPGIPRGAKVAVIEGAPPFPANRTFTMLAKLPKHYMIPPHTHLVTERVTVLQGELSFGHGATIDRKAATKVRAGGYITIPQGHVHYAFTTNKETTIALTGVGPWEIIYVNPKNDPRPTPARIPVNFVPSTWDGHAESKIVQANEVKFGAPPPGLLPPAIKMAVLEGDPNVAKVFTVRLLLPKGQKIPIHKHTFSERVTLLSGGLGFTFGDTWEDDALQTVKTGSVILVKEGELHYGRATKGNTVLQVTGVGPFDLHYADPADAPTPTP